MDKIMQSIKTFNKIYVSLGNGYYIEVSKTQLALTLKAMEADMRDFNNIEIKKYPEIVYLTFNKEINSTTPA